MLKPGRLDHVNYSFNLKSWGKKRANEKILQVSNNPCGLTRQSAVLLFIKGEKLTNECNASF